MGNNPPNFVVVLKKEMKKQIRLDWFRHGKTVSNKIRDTEGFMGFFKQAFIGENLHSEGIQETQEIANGFMKDNNLLNSYDCVFCSMLPRSIQTAVILLKNFPKKKIYVVPNLNENRPWWGIGMDLVNWPETNVNILQEKIIYFAEENGITKDEILDKISFEYVDDSEKWKELNVSSPENFYRFLEEFILPNANNMSKFLIISHSWYMYYNFQLPLILNGLTYFKIPNNFILCEKGEFDNDTFMRNSIHYVLDPTLPVDVNQEYYLYEFSDQ